MCWRVHVGVVALEAEGVKSPGTEVAGDFELSNMGTGNQIQVPLKNSITLYIMGFPHDAHEGTVLFTPSHLRESDLILLTIGDFKKYL